MASLYAFHPLLSDLLWISSLSPRVRDQFYHGVAEVLNAIYGWTKVLENCAGWHDVPSQLQIQPALANLERYAQLYGVLISLRRAVSEVHDSVGQIGV